MHQHISVMLANAHNVQVEDTVNVKDWIPGPEIVKPVIIAYPELRSKHQTMESLVTSVPVVRFFAFICSLKPLAVLPDFGVGNRSKIVRRVICNIPKYLIVSGL